MKDGGEDVILDGGRDHLEFDFGSPRISGLEKIIGLLGRQ